MTIANKVVVFNGFQKSRDSSREVEQEDLPKACPEMFRKRPEARSSPISIGEILKGDVSIATSLNAFVRENYESANVYVLADELGGICDAVSDSNCSGNELAKRTEIALAILDNHGQRLAGTKQVTKWEEEIAGLIKEHTYFRRGLMSIKNKSCFVPTPKSEYTDYYVEEVTMREIDGDEAVC